MTLIAYDSANPPNRQAIKAAGGIAVARYVKRNLPNSFDLGSTERLNTLADGLGLLYNAEQNASDVLVQSTSWWMDYGKYTSDRLQAFGVRTDMGVNVPASADCQVSSADLSKAVNNLAAFAAGVEPFGMIGYGQISVLNLLTVEKISPVGSKHWLTASIGWSMPGTGPGGSHTSADWDAYMAWPHAGMVQMLGSNVAGTDMNYLLDPVAMGFEWPTSSPYYPKPDPPEDEDMDKMIIAIDPTTNGGAGGVYLLYGNGVLTNIEVDSDRVALEATTGPAIPQAIVSLATWNAMNETSERVLAAGAADPAAVAAQLAADVTFQAAVSAGVAAGPSLTDITGAITPLIPTADAIATAVLDAEAARLQA